jgi:predicted phosphoadenosine phosphosulfate sulfurtransferase
MEKNIVQEIKKYKAEDINQYGNCQGTSSSHLLVKLINQWLVKTDNNEKFIRVLFIDYHKAFDRIDHIKRGYTTRHYLRKWFPTCGMRTPGGSSETSRRYSKRKCVMEEL